MKEEEIIKHLPKTLRLKDTPADANLIIKLIPTVEAEAIWRGGYVCRAYQRTIKVSPSFKGDTIEEVLNKVYEWVCNLDNLE